MYERTLYFLGNPQFIDPTGSARAESMPASSSSSCSAWGHASPDSTRIKLHFVHCRWLDSLPPVWRDGSVFATRQWQTWGHRVMVVVPQQISLFEGWVKGFEGLPHAHWTSEVSK